MFGHTRTTMQSAAGGRPPVARHGWPARTELRLALLILSLLSLILFFLSLLWCSFFSLLLDESVAMAEIVLGAAGRVSCFWLEQSHKTAKFDFDEFSFSSGPSSQAPKVIRI